MHTSAGSPATSKFDQPVHTWRDIPGWFQWRRHQEEAAAHFPDGSWFVEVGCYLGRSICSLGEVVISDSVRAAALFADGSLSWVHIDARHDYASVVADITAWAPKVAPGGWLSGDDYHAGQWPGVVRAVADTLPDAGPWWSTQWRWIKPVRPAT